MVPALNPSGVEIYLTLWAHPALCTMGTGYLGVKWLGLDVDYPHPYSTEVKERVELYLFSPSELSWSILGCTFSPLLETAEKHAKRWSETEVGKLGNVA